MLIFNPYGLSLRIVPINPGDFSDYHVISGLDDHHYGNYMYIITGTALPKDFCEIFCVPVI